MTKYQNFFKTVTDKSAHTLHLSPGFLAVIIAHIIWGINFLVAKVTLQEIPPYSLSFLRFFLALILLLPFLFIERRKLRFEIKDLPYILLVGTFMTTFNIALFYEGIQRSTPIDASVLSMIVPIISVLIGWTLLKEKIFMVNLVGIGFGLLGALTVLGGPQLLGSSTNPDRLIGNLLLVLSSICFVTGSSIARVYLRKYSALMITTSIFLIATLAFILPALNEYLKDPNWVTQVDIVGIFGLFFIVIASSISAFFLFEWGLMKVGVVKADLFQYVEPLIATTLAVIILGEPLKYSLIIGGILIGLGVYWGTLGKDHHKVAKYHRH